MKSGTEITTAVPSVRPANLDDVPQIYARLEVYAAMGNLLPRSLVDITQNLADFCVIEVNNEVIACGALEVSTHELGEIRSLAVDDRFANRGLGRAIVQYLLLRAKTKGLKRLMALTYTPTFFHKLGFSTVPKSRLPEKVWGACVSCYKFHRCDETAVLRPI